MAGYWDTATRVYGALSRAMDDDEARGREREYGDAYKSGGYAAVADAAGARGDFTTATQAGNAGLQQSERDRTARERRMAVFNNVLNGVRRLPYEARRQRIQQIAPRLMEEGFTQQQIEAYDPTDEKIEADLAMAGQFSQFSDIKQDEAGRWVGVTRDGRVVPIDGAPEPPRVQRMTPDAAAAAGYRPGSVVQVSPDGTERVTQAPREFAPPSGDASEQRVFQRAGSLRDDYRGEPVVKGFQEIRNVYDRSKAYLSRVGNGRGAPVGDIGLVFALAKINDPTSVVREQEFAQIAESGGYGQKIKNLVSQASGRGFDPATRAQLVAEIESAYRTFSNTYQQTQSHYAELARRYGVDPADVVLGYDEAAANAPQVLPIPATRREMQNGGLYQMSDGSVGIYDAASNKFYAPDDPRVRNYGIASSGPASGEGEPRYPIPNTGQGARRIKLDPE